jgi:hypothetical protein
MGNWLNYRMSTFLDSLVITNYRLLVDEDDLSWRLALACQWAVDHVVPDVVGP